MKDCKNCSVGMIRRSRELKRRQHIRNGARYGGVRGMKKAEREIILKEIRGKNLIENSEESVIK